MIGKKEKAESGNMHKVFITFVMTIFCKTGGGGLYSVTTPSGCAVSRHLLVILFRDHMAWRSENRKQQSQ